MSSNLRTYKICESVIFFKTKEEWGGLSNMGAGFPIAVNDVKIKTSEALYQAMRFPFDPDVQKEIIDQASPMTAKMKSRAHLDKSRPDWDSIKVSIMRWSLQAKLLCNFDSFGKLLLATGDKPIVEKSFKDQFWGAEPQHDGTIQGINCLGRLLMQLREELKEGKYNKDSILQPPSVEHCLLYGNPIR